MKRFFLSILCGILFPILYMIIVGLVDDFLFPQQDIITMKVYGQNSMGWILAPIAIPVWIYDFIRFNQYLGLRIIFDTIWFRVIWTLGFNFLFYTILSYLSFWYFGLFQSTKPTNSQNPPLPPEFKTK